MKSLNDIIDGYAAAIAAVYDSITDAKVDAVELLEAVTPGVADAYYQREYRADPANRYHRII